MPSLGGRAGGGGGPGHGGCGFIPGGFLALRDALSAVSILVTVLLHPAGGGGVDVGVSLAFRDPQLVFRWKGRWWCVLGGMAGVARSLHVRTRRDLTLAGLWVAGGGGAAVVMLALMERWPLPQHVFSTLKWVGGGAFFGALRCWRCLPLLEICFSRLVQHPSLGTFRREPPAC
jgi:hypothetical protein